MQWLLCWLAHCSKQVQYNIKIWSYQAMQSWTCWWTTQKWNLLTSPHLPEHKISTRIWRWLHSLHTTQYKQLNTTLPSAAYLCSTTKHQDIVYIYAGLSCSVYHTLKGILTVFSNKFVRTLWDKMLFSCLRMHWKALVVVVLLQLIRRLSVSSCEEV